MKFLTLDQGHVTPLDSEIDKRVSRDCPAHMFESSTINALNAAIAARRPLLVRGEPGIGKTQLARAAAKELGSSFVQHVIDSRTESRDLMWHFDSISRLAEAQISGASNLEVTETRRRLATENFVLPGALWWAFDWTSAQEQADKASGSTPSQTYGGSPEKGTVVLIDEIDKGESDVPNGLLEPLGAGQFTPPGQREPVSIKGEFPLIIITTNEERTLPDAFIRRCLVLNLNLPILPEEEEKFQVLLVERGAAHFPHSQVEVRDKAATLLIGDRREAMELQRRPLPGQAEYLDLLRAVLALHPDNPDQQLDALDIIGGFVVRKYVPEAT